MKNFDWKFWIGMVAIPILLAWITWQGVLVQQRTLELQLQQERAASIPGITAAPPAPSLTATSSWWPDMSPYWPYWPIGVMVLLIGINATVATRHRRGLSATAKELSSALKKIDELNEQAAAKKPYPTVEIWHHVAGNLELANKLRDLFAKAGWEVKYGYPTNLPKQKDALAELIDVSPTSGAYFNNLGSLRSLGLIDYPRSSEAVALPVLFLEA